jgi:hypothetical protein
MTVGSSMRFDRDTSIFYQCLPSSGWPVSAYRRKDKLHSPYYLARGTARLVEGQTKFWHQENPESDFVQSRATDVLRRWNHSLPQVMLFPAAIRSVGKIVGP